jgi:alpha-tubulin suppressor-like RCC1 family protein
MRAIDLKARLSGPRALALAAPTALCLLGLFFSAGAQASGATVQGWGSNSLGQLGNGTITTPGIDPCECIKAPVPVTGLSGATQIAAGTRDTLALLANGAVVAWGDNEVGQLGNESLTASAVPVLVPRLANVVSIAAGSGHSLALLANGTVMAWGDNSVGALGNGEFRGPEICGGLPCSKVPLLVPGLANVVAIAAGERFSLALLANGTVMAWGENSVGEDGDGSGTRTGCFCVDRPTAVPGIAGAVAISSGLLSGYALLSDGTVKAWGFDEMAQLGQGAGLPASGCTCRGPVAVSGLSGVKAISSGAFHAMATLSSGSLQAWGFNLTGEVGNGEDSPSNPPCFCIATPTPVSGLSSPQAIEGGSTHNLALLADGRVEGWGSNEAGQLGDGSLENHNKPTAVSTIAGASGIGAGQGTSFALIGPSQTLKVSMAGAGSGTVGTQGLLCPSSCEGRYPQSQVEILRPEPSPGSGFAGFSGPCTGTAPCQVKLDQDQTVTATFGPPKGTAITATKVSGRGKSASASFDFTAPGAITGFECELIRPKKPVRKRHKPHKSHKPKGHRLMRASVKQPTPSFSSCATPTLFKHLTPGHYTFQVRALDILGADANPAMEGFKIKAKKAKKRKHRR